MKDDYLWNGEGRDSEIEKLENALSVFRSEKKAPPALPAAIVSLPEKPARRNFRWRYVAAAAACLAFITISAGVWLRSSGNLTREARINNVTRENRIDAPENYSPGQITDKKRDENQIETDFVSPSKTNENPARGKERKSFKIEHKTPRAIVRRAQLVAVRRVKTPKPEIRLTEEEKYAYNQLMLALSITGSKLKFVKDKAESVEEKSVEHENGR